MHCKLAQVLFVRYRLDALLGKDVFVEVYCARRLPLNAPRALKMLR